MTMAFTGATCIIDARFASEISPKNRFVRMANDILQIAAPPYGQVWNSSC